MSSERISKRLGKRRLATTQIMILRKAANIPWNKRVKKAQMMKKVLCQMQSQNAIRRKLKFSKNSESKQSRLVPQQRSNEGYKKESKLGAPQIANTQPTIEAETPLSSARIGNTVQGEANMRNTLEVGSKTAITKQQYLHRDSFSVDTQISCSWDSLQFYSMVAD